MSGKGWTGGGLRSEGAGATLCDWWESMLADAQDGTLSAADKEKFDTHTRECADCAALWAEAEQGKAWANMLRENPPVPADLLGKILARTEGVGGVAGIDVSTVIADGQAVAVPSMPAVWMPRAARDARLVMTAAMAFFSIALTMSLLGFKPTSVHAAELKPSAVQANISKQYYGTRREVVNFYSRLRVVLEVESEFRELRQGATASGTPAAQKPQDKGPTSRKGSARHTPAGTVAGPAEMASRTVTPTERKQA